MADIIRMEGLSIRDSIVRSKDASTAKGPSKLRAKGLETGAGPKEI